MGTVSGVPTYELTCIIHHALSSSSAPVYFSLVRVSTRKAIAWCITPYPLVHAPSRLSFTAVCSTREEMAWCITPYPVVHAPPPVRFPLLCVSFLLSIHPERRSLGVALRVFGSRHPAVAAETNVLAVFLVEHGRNREAEACYRNSMDIWERTLGPYSPELASGLNNLAILLFVEDRPGCVIRSEKLVLEHFHNRSSQCSSISATVCSCAVVWLKTMASHLPRLVEPPPPDYEAPR